SHQARAWELIQKGQHVVIVTPTASGKTLCYNLPALQALVHQPDARVLYLFPTKALAQDQLAELEELARQLPEMRMFTYDGDTPQDARRAVRARANLVLTNPDMLHTGEQVEEITESGAPTGDKIFVCYNPPVVNPELGIRAPYLGEAAKLAIRFLRQKIATIVFAQSRLATEVLLTAIKGGVADKTG